MTDEMKPLADKIRNEVAILRAAGLTIVRESADRLDALADRVEALVMAVREVMVMETGLTVEQRQGDRTPFLKGRCSGRQDAKNILRAALDTAKGE